MTNPTPKLVWPFVPGAGASILIDAPTHPGAVVRIQAQLNGLPAGEATEYNAYAARQLIDAVQAQLDAGTKESRKPTAREVYDKLQPGDRFYLTTGNAIKHELRIKVADGGYIDPKQANPSVQGRSTGGVLTWPDTKVELS